jgi:hypothetical protein
MLYMWAIVFMTRDQENVEDLIHFFTTEHTVPVCGPNLNTVKR